MLSISRNVRLFVCQSVRVSVCLFTFEVPFNGLFAPTSRSQMSNIFRDSESLGKSNGKKWSQIWTFLFENCRKSPRKKKFFFLSLFPLLRYRLTVFLPPLPAVGCPIFLKIRNPWGKVMERSGLTFEHFCLEVVILPWSTFLRHRCYYPHRSRDALSPVCGTFCPGSLYVPFRMITKVSFTLLHREKCWGLQDF